MSALGASFLMMGVIGLLAVGVLGLGIALYNGLVRARTMAEEGWSGIEVQLQRRADLVPNLVEVVKGHAAHEKGVFEEIAARRSAAIGARDKAARTEAEQGLTAALGRLIAVAEAYPTLTADKSFLTLQKDLAAVEDTLQDARRYYNATVRELNLKVETFPSALIARSFGFSTAPYFDAGDDAALRAPPRVSFGGAGGGAASGG
ncbi:MAG: LemA family protein [Acetobacteraceae bacterium]|jgi:LemA protein|nr:LemA family protein [Acetobacteraceae bacterium]